MGVTVNVELIEKERKFRNYTLYRMAEELNYKGESTYYNKVTGHRSFTIKDIAMISEVLSIKLEDLIMVSK